MSLDPGLLKGLVFMAAQRLGPAVDTTELLVCHCAHTGDFRVITRASGDHCHKCQPNNCQPITRASLQGAFNFCAEQRQKAEAERAEAEAERAEQRKEAAAALQREMWLDTLNITRHQRNFLRQNPEYEIVDPISGYQLEKIGLLDMGGVFKENNAYASGLSSGSIAIGIKRKLPS